MDLCPITAEVVHHGKTVVVLALATAAFVVNSAYDTCSVDQAIFAGFEGSVPAHRTAAALHSESLYGCSVENHVLHFGKSLFTGLNRPSVLLLTSLEGRGRSSGRVAQV